MSTSQEKADKAIEKLMLKEGGGKITMPKSVESSPIAVPKKIESPVDETKQRAPNKRKQTSIKPDNSGVKRTKTCDYQSGESVLKDVFYGAKLFISSKIPENEVLKRYCVAFGGEVHSDKKSADIIVLEKECARDKCVTKDWIIREIKK